MGKKLFRSNDFVNLTLISLIEIIFSWQKPNDVRINTSALLSNIIQIKHFRIDFHRKFKKNFSIDFISFDLNIFSSFSEHISFIHSIFFFLQIFSTFIYSFFPIFNGSISTRTNSTFSSQFHYNIFFSLLFIFF